MAFGLGADVFSQGQLDYPRYSSVTARPTEMSPTPDRRLHRIRGTASKPASSALTVEAIVSQPCGIGRPRARPPSGSRLLKGARQPAARDGRDLLASQERLQAGCAGPCHVGCGRGRHDVTLGPNRPPRSLTTLIRVSPALAAPSVQRSRQHLSHANTCIPSGGATSRALDLRTAPVTVVCPDRVRRASSSRHVAHATASRPDQGVTTGGSHAGSR